MSTSAYLIPDSEGNLRAANCEQDRQPQNCQPCELVQPKFFCGQLLTDQDLSQLLLWSKNRFGLDRYTEGWGIVHGFGVECAPQSAASVTILPGYAVDHCGNDILLCDSLSLSLAEACHWGANKSGGNACEDFSPPPPQKEIDCLGFTFEASEVFAVDVLLHHHPIETRPIPALGRGACQERDACEFTRVDETAAVSWRRGQAAGDPFSPWETEYFSRSRAVVDAFRQRFDDFSNDDVPAIKAWFNEWIGNKGLYHFCLVKLAVERLERSSENLHAEVAGILFYLVLDRRLHYLAQPLPQGPRDLLLARIWLRRYNQPESGCDILQVDTGLPERRQFLPEHWPAPFYHTNLGQFIHQPAHEVCRFLRDANVPYELEDVSVPQNIAVLLNHLDKELAGENPVGLFLDRGCGSASNPFLKVFCLVTDKLGKRVIGFLWDDYPRAGVLAAESEPDEGGKQP